jgi:hypothetical protein
MRSTVSPWKNKIGQRFRCILRNSLACISIDGLAPIILGYLYVREIGFIGEFAKFSKVELG